MSLMHISKIFLLVPFSNVRMVGRANRQNQNEQTDILLDRGLGGGGVGVKQPVVLLMFSPKTTLRRNFLHPSATILRNAIGTKLYIAENQLFL